MVQLDFWTVQMPRVFFQLKMPWQEASDLLCRKRPVSGSNATTISEAEMCGPPRQTRKHVL